MADKQEISDESWVVLEPLFPVWKGNGRPIVDMRRTVEGVAWRFRTGAPLRDVPERFGNWNSIYRRFSAWSKDGTWSRVLATVQANSAAAIWTGPCPWTPRSPASTSTARPFPGAQGARPNYRKLGDQEPADHAISKSRGGMTCKIHLAADGKGRPLGLVLTAGNAADTSFFQTVLETITVPPGTRGRPRRVLADKAYTSKANRDYLTAGIKVTIPERTDQKKNRARRGSNGGRPGSFDKDAHKSRNVVERCFNRLKQWRGIATRRDKTARSSLAGVTFAAALIWIKSAV